MFTVNVQREPSGHYLIHNMLYLYYGYANRPAAMIGVEGSKTQQRSVCGQVKLHHQYSRCGYKESSIHV